MDTSTIPTPMKHMSPMAGLSALMKISAWVVEIVGHGWGRIRAP